MRRREEEEKVLKDQKKNESGPTVVGDEFQQMKGSRSQKGRETGRLGDVRVGWDPRRLKKCQDHNTGKQILVSIASAFRFRVMRWLAVPVVPALHYRNYMHYVATAQSQVKANK